MGGATPAAIELPANGPSTNALSSSFLTYEDMRGALECPDYKRVSAGLFGVRWIQ